MASLAILGALGLGGYLLQNDGNIRQKKFNRQSISKDEIPNGADIYNNKRYSDVEKHVQNLSDINYAKSRDPINTGIIPPVFNTLGINECCDFKENRPSISSVSSGSGILSNKAQPSLNSGNISKNQKQIFGGPMFTSMNKLSSTNFADISTLGVKSTPVTQENSNSILQNERSLLTGQDLDHSHNNMVPFFGSTVKQNTGNAQQRTLEMFSGTDRTYMAKRELEQEKMFSPIPQDIFGTPNIPEELRKERFVQSNLKNNVLPFPQERVAPGLNQKGYGTEGQGGFHDRFRPHIRNVDELRVKTNPKLTFEGRVITGSNQATQQRGQLGVVKKHRPDRFYVNDPRRYGPGRAANVEMTERENFENLQCTNSGNEILELAGHARASVGEAKPSPIRADYLGNIQDVPIDQRNYTGVQTIHRDGRNTTFKNDSMRNINLEGKDVNDYNRAGYYLLEEERATTGPATERHQLNIGGPQEQISHFYDDARETIADTLSQDNRNGMLKGNVATGTGYQIEEYQDLPTNRQMTGLRGYTGIGSAHISETRDYSDMYNAHISDRKEKIINERAHGPQKSNITNGACYENMVIKSQISSIPNQFAYAPAPEYPLIQNGEMKNLTQHRKNPPKRIDCRIEPDILNAFRENPFTHSLNVW